MQKHNSYYAIHMNEFMAKKLGEVLAINQLGIETFEKAAETLKSSLGETLFTDHQSTLRIHNESITTIATEHNVLEIVSEKASKTKNKISGMRDTYIGEKWDDIAELMEWSGFFEGAAIVHWGLVQGIAEGINDEALLVLANESLDFHHEMLDKTKGELHSIGQQATE